LVHDKRCALENHLAKAIPLGRPLLQDTGFGKKAWDFEGVFSKGRRDVARCHRPQTANRRVAQGAKDLWRRLCADAAGIFGERDVTNPVQTVFDSPVTSPPLKSLSRIGLRSRHAADGVVNFYRRVCAEDSQNRCERTYKNERSVSHLFAVLQPRSFPEIP
jgi:hypothetical protein